MVYNSHKKSFQNVKDISNYNDQELTKNLANKGYAITLSLQAKWFRTKGYD